MPRKQYRVRLTAAERHALHRRIHTGWASAFVRRRAQIWLLTDEGPAGPRQSDSVVARTLGVGTSTVFRARQALAQKGLEAGLQTAPMDHPRTPRKLDGAGEARLMALAGGAPPPGYARWTGALLAEALVREGVVDAISPTTVHATLKKCLET